ATPHVSGALALLIEWSKKEFGRTLTETELYGQLIKYTKTLPLARTLQGNGLVYLNLDKN
ncbi:MAG: serine protease, partial [Clostridium sp.]